MLYTKMIKEPDKAHIINSLLEYALKRDKEFKAYKAEIKKQLNKKQEGQVQSTTNNSSQNQEQLQNRKEAGEDERGSYEDKPT